MTAVLVGISALLTAVIGMGGVDSTNVVVAFTVATAVLLELQATCPGVAGTPSTSAPYSCVAPTYIICCGTIETTVRGSLPRSPQAATLHARTR